MAKKLKLGGPAKSEEVDERYKASRKPHERERLQAIRMGQQRKFTLATIAKVLDRGRATVARWVKAYKEEGLEGLLRRRHKGRQAKLSKADIEELKKGLLEGKWKTAREIQEWLQKERGIDLKLGGVYYWLNRLKGSWKVPRKSNIKKNEKAAEEFKQEIVSKLEGLSVTAGQDVHVWVEDEHRYGLISVIRRCWTLKGHRPTAPYQAKYQWGYVYAAADVVTGRAEFLFTPSVTLEWSHEFLKQLGATDSEAIHIVIWDRAGFHPEADDPKLPESIRLLPLPSYSPELNPIEPLWDQVKRRVANCAWETMEKIEAAISEVLEPFWQNVERVRSLLGDTWLTRGVATFLEQRKSLIFK